MFLIIACSPSSQEKEEIAVLTCNIIGESGNMDAAFRIKEINGAREQIGEDRFLGTDDEILVSFELGLCKELVLNDKKYKIKLEEANYANYLNFAKKVAVKGVSINRPDSLPDRELQENAPIRIAVGPTGEVWMDGLKIDIGAVRENVERIIAENPQRSQSVVIQSDENATTDNIIQIMDAAREAGIYSISLASKPIN